MKTLIAAVSLAAFSVPVPAAEPADSGQPPLSPSSLQQMGTDYPLGGTPPNNKLDAAPVPPGTDTLPERFQVASAGSTRWDAELSASAGATVAEDESPWARDHNFIAPPP
jgi:hypothetical protein